jgi:hypothetical protein
MKHLLTTLLLATLCATGYAQTLKSVMIDTNGVQVNQFGSGSATSPAIKLGATNWGFWRATGPDRIFVSVNGSTGATFTSNSVAATTFSGNLSGGVTIGSGQSISFSGGANVSGTRTNLGLGATWLTNTNVTNFRTAIGLGATNDVEFNSLTAGALYWQTNVVFEIETATFFTAPDFDSLTIAAATRTNLSLPLPALTNTSNVTTMRALAGSTNTNQPFSGTLSWQDYNDDTVSIVVSNGIILSVSEP